MVWKVSQAGAQGVKNRAGEAEAISRKPAPMLSFLKFLKMFNFLSFREGECFRRFLRFLGSKFSSF
jgi:hypothetical protein